MNKRTGTFALGIVILVLIALASLWPAFISPSQEAATEPWTEAWQAKARQAIFNTTLYSGQPSHSGKPSGMREDLKIIYGYMGPDFKGSTWVRYPGENDEDLKYLVRQAVEMGVTRLLLDVEDASDAVRNAKILRQRDIIKSIAPSMLVGNFAYPRNYFPATPAQNAAANDAAKAVMEKLDFGCGVAYTSCLVPQDMSKWMAFVQGIIREGHRVMPGKEIYVALDVDYSDYGWNGPMLAQGPLEPDMLIQEIKSTLTSGADGVLLWGCTRTVKQGVNDVPAPWDSRDPWYKSLGESGMLSLTPPETAGSRPATNPRIVP